MGSETIHIEKGLLLRIAAGDTQSFRALYERYHRKVYFIAWRLLGTENESEDVCQEIFTKLWVNREKLPALDNLNAYINTLIRNYIYNSLRKKASEEAFVMETLQTRAGHLSEGMDAAELQELRQNLRKAMRKLPPQQRRVFELSHMEGYKHEDIARELQISRETVKKHVMAAIRNIRGFLSREGNEILYFFLWLVLR